MATAAAAAAVWTWSLRCGGVDLVAAAVNSCSSAPDRGGGGGSDAGGLDVVAALWIFGAPVIFTVGIAGNGLVLAVTSSIVF